MHTTSAQDKLALYQITHFLEQNLAPQDRGLSSEWVGVSRLKETHLFSHITRQDIRNEQITRVFSYIPAYSPSKQRIPLFYNWSCVPLSYFFKRVF